MRLRLLVVAWLLSAVTHADDAESVSRSSELLEEAGMVSSNNESYRIVGRVTTRKFFNALTYSGPSTGSILVNRLQLSKAGKCISTEILWWLGASKEQIADAYATKDKDQVDCSPSSDGSLTTKESEAIPAFDLIFPTRRVGEHRLEDPTFRNSYKSDELDRFNKTLLMEPVTKKQYQNMQNFCNASGCHFRTIIALVFAGANYFDTLGRPIAAAMHRLVAFDALDLQSLPEKASHRIQEANFKDGLKLHAKALLKYSFDTEDYQLANEAKYILMRLEALDSETEARLNEWELNLEGAVTPISVTLPLVTDTPVSKYHYAVSKGLALKEFGISTDGVDLAYAFLKCAEKKVTLVTAARSAWVIPDDWEDCRLTLLSDEPAKATITEYPDGYVDRNGNLSI